MRVDLAMDLAMDLDLDMNRNENMKEFKEEVSLTDYARRLRMECVTEEQVDELLSELDPSTFKKTSTVARSMVSELKSSQLGARGMEEFMSLQSQILDLEFLIWKLGSRDSFF